jgi:HK97 family phage portal protein
VSERSQHLARLRLDVTGRSEPLRPVGSVAIAPPPPSRGARLMAAVGNGLRRLSGMVFRGNASRLFWLPGSRRDYLRQVGDGTGSSTVTAPLFWVARTFPEAPPALWEKLENGQEQQTRDHPMLRLLERPNRFYTGVETWMATVTEYYVDGNAYWIKLRDRAGLVSELWWTPSWVMEPRGDDKNLVTHYEYRPGAEPLEVRVEDVVHFRFGIDPDNPMLGRSPLKSVLREVFTDDEAAQFTASLLSNMGVPGLMVSPEKGVTIADDQALEAKQSLLEKFTGDKRGEPIVMTGATKIEQFGFSPEQLLLRELRRIPEERVTAVMGVPAIVAGLGAGLDRSTFTNMAEAREAAYESGIIPVQRILAEVIRWQLLNEFERDPYLWRFGFDLTKVRVLQEDLYRLVQRHAVALREGAEMVSEFRRALDLPVEPDRDDVFLRAINVATVPAGVAGRSDAPASSSNGNGAAHHLPAEIAAAVEAMLDRRALMSA